MQLPTRALATVFLGSFFFSTHLALISYINSSMLGSYVSANIVSVLFATGSALSIVLMLFAPKLMRRHGTVRFSLVLFLLSASLAWVLGTTGSSQVVLFAFVAYFSLNTCIVYCLDLFIEHYSPNAKTGNIRGLALTINSLGWVAMPLIVGNIASNYGFGALYILAAVALCLSGITIAISQRNFVESAHVVPHFRTAFAYIRNTPALRRIISIHFLLQFFFSWMVLYVPLYLAHTLLLPWSSIGGIFSIMLLPFVLFQYPAGRIADKWLGEKGLLIAGLIVMSVSTGIFALISTPSIALLAALLFCTRIGASVVEVMSDSYFFKQVNDTDTNVISLYRTMQPFAYVIGPITGAVLLLLVPYTTLFLLLALLLALGALYAFRLVNTQ